MEENKIKSRVLQECLPWLELLTNTIFNDSKSPNDFEIKFCKGNPVINCSFNEDEVLFQYETWDGLTAYESISIEDFDNWLEEELGDID